MIYSQSPKKNDKRQLAWTEDTLQAFEPIKQPLTNAALLAHPVSSAELRLTTDASNTAMCSILEQKVDDQ